jgi:hypothetical protein
MSKARPAVERGLNRYGELLSGSKANSLQSHVDDVSKLLRGPNDRIQGISAAFANARPRTAKVESSRAGGTLFDLVGMRSRTLHPETDVQTLMDTRPNALIEKYLLNPAKQELSSEKGLSGLTRIGTGLGLAEVGSRALTGTGLPTTMDPYTWMQQKAGGTGKEASVIAQLHPIQQLVLHKQASERVSFHFANMLKLSMAMKEFDVDLLCKHAAVGLDRASRLKYAALAIRYQQEKEAFAALLPLLRGILQASGGVGKGLLTAGGGVAKGLGQAASGIGSGALEASKALTPTAKGTGSAALKGLRGLAKGVSDATGAYGNFLQRNPRVGGATSAALGVGAGLSAPSVARSYGKAQDTMAGVGKDVGSALQGALNSGSATVKSIRDAVKSKL